MPYETPRALETGEIAGVIEAFRQARGERARGRLRRRRDPWRQRLSDRAVPAVAHQFAHRPIWRLDREPRAVAAGSHAGRDRGLGRGPRRRAAVALRRSPMAAASPIRCRSTRHVVKRSIRLGWPICISSSRARAAPAAPRSTIRTCRRRWCCSGRSGSGVLIRPAASPARPRKRRSRTAMPTPSPSAASSFPIRTCRAACGTAFR